MLEAREVKTSYGTIFGMSAGDPGSPLILGIHGWSQRNGWHTWEPLLQPLGDAGFFAFSVDMPGWGKSKSPDHPQANTGTAVQAVIEIVTGLDRKRVILMGKSWGGGVALRTALDHPELVTKLVLSAPAFRDIDRLVDLKPPVLLAWAEDDPVIPIRYSAEYERTVPDIQLVRYEFGGHSAAAKNAGEFAPVVVDFLSRASGR